MEATARIYDFREEPSESFKEVVLPRYSNFLPRKLRIAYDIRRSLEKCVDCENGSRHNSYSDVELTQDDRSYIRTSVKVSKEPRTKLLDF